ncbi:MAG: hypothetical protein FWE76_07535, partial [Symbiobacteriaceae bacterium]|nr:hypothetical protein [Symbiobacteriaceae bacterium]
MIDLYKDTQDTTDPYCSGAKHQLLLKRYANARRIAMKLSLYHRTLAMMLALCLILTGCSS